jgi:RNA-directed DNA polymerase
MWLGLDQAVSDAATRQIREHEGYVRAVLDENARRQRRSKKTTPLLEVRRPERWQSSPAFNPYLVRARSSAIAHSIGIKLKSGTYTPLPPERFFIPKLSGGDREISTFAIADEVISKRLYKSLMRKNASRLSSHAFAYRKDRTPHDALNYVYSGLKKHQRIFVAEYDFSSFFDNISHEYLHETMAELNIISSPLEKRLVEAFLATSDFEARMGEASGAPRGLRQGTSISLFLANIAATPMDQALERLGVDFARYADDTLIWSESYDQICKASDLLHEAAKSIGSPINSEKSPGIRLLVSSAAQASEMPQTTSIHYLGHTLGLSSIRMKSSVISRIKDRVQILLYTNLLMEPLRRNQARDRLGGNDRDYVTYIWQLRRYLYGPLSENEVRRYQQRAAPNAAFEGVMAFFPLIDDQDDLVELDVWIATQTWLALQKRARLLQGNEQEPRTWGLTRSQLVGLQVVSGRSGQSIDLRIPSVRRIATAIRLGVSVHGFESAADGADLYLYD